MKTSVTMTPEEAKELLSRKGISTRAWALEHGFTPSLVHMVLTGARQTRIGQSHNVAVMLGIKEGELNEVAACRKQKSR
jgi:gp16 family phage-associated protein